MVGNSIPALATPTQNTEWVKSQAIHPKLNREIQLARAPKQEAKKYRRYNDSRSAECGCKLNNKMISLHQQNSGMGRYPIL
jgi:hypothetical protein